MTRDDGFTHVFRSHAQLLLGSSSEAKIIYDGSGRLRQMPQAAHKDVYKTPQAPEQADVLELADNTPQFSPMRPRQLCFGRTSKGIVKRPKGVVCARRAASDVGRPVRVKPGTHPRARCSGSLALSLSTAPQQTSEHTRSNTTTAPSSRTTHGACSRTAYGSSCQTPQTCPCRQEFNICQGFGTKCGVVLK